MLARVLHYEDPGTRPRYALVSSGRRDASPEEAAERLLVAPQILLRDATADFPAPLPRGLRSLAMVRVLHVVRSSADPRQAGRWLDLPSLSIATVAPATAEEAVLEPLEAEVAQVLTRTIWRP